MSITVWDLDSTISNTSPRHHLSPFVNPDETWHSYAKACWMDLPMAGTIKLIHTFYRAGNSIHILTGRRETARFETIQWLNKYDVPYHRLRMRRDDDLESNTDYKIEYMRNLSELPVLFVSDWSPECQAVRSVLGIASVCINPEYGGSQDPTMGQWRDNAPSLLEHK